MCKEYIIYGIRSIILSRIIYVYFEYFLRGVVYVID